MSVGARQRTGAPWGGDSLFFLLLCLELVRIAPGTKTARARVNKPHLQNLPAKDIFFSFCYGPIRGGLLRSRELRTGVTWPSKYIWLSERSSPRVGGTRSYEPSARNSRALTSSRR